MLGESEEKRGKEKMRHYQDATGTREVILGLPFDSLSELEFVAFNLTTRERKTVA